MKDVTDLKGMHDIPTQYGFTKPAAPTTKTRLVAELAHLAHERNRLSANPNQWLCGRRRPSRRRVEIRLRALGEREAFLRRVCAHSQYRRAQAGRI